MFNLRKIASKKDRFAFLLLPAMAASLIVSSGAYAGPDDAIVMTKGTIIDEVENNNTNSQYISDYFDILNFDNDVLINAGLSSKTDVDKFSFYSSAGNSFKIQCNIKELPHNDLVLIDTAEDITVFVTDNNVIWKPDGNNIDKITDDLAIAAAIPTLTITDIVINDISVNDGHDIAIALPANVCRCDSDGIVSLLYTQANISAATGIANPEITSVALDNAGNVYITDKTSGMVLKGTLAGVALQVLMEDSIDLLTTAIAAGKLDITLDEIAVTTGTFRPTYMIKVSGSSIYSDGFYATQFSASSGGNGQITLISQDLDLGTSYNFDTFMATSASIVNPTALALDTNGSFDNAMFMGTFGSNLGNVFDGKVYKISAGGVATSFVTSYVDMEGNPVTRGTSSPQAVTGFYDVIDMKFSPAASAYGDYLYVLSENIKDSTDQGSNSDIWRIDPTGKATLFKAGIMSAAGRMVFDTSGVFGNKLIVAPWGGENYNNTIKTIDADGTVTNLYTVDSNIMDIAIAPASSIFAGALLITYTDNTLVALDYDPANPGIIRATTWADNLSIGDIPGGNMVFDAENNLYILNGDDKAIVKFDYAKHLVKSVVDTKIQHIVNPQSGAVNDIPYFLADTDARPIIYSRNVVDSEPVYTMIGNSNNFDDEDTADTVGMSFSSEGHCYLYSNMGGYIKVAEWDQDGSAFGSFVALPDIALDEIGADGGYTYPEIKGVAVARNSASSDTPLYAIVSNAINNLPDTVTTPLSQNGDDSILSLGDAVRESYSVSKAFSIDNFNAMTIKVKGPGDNSTVSYSGRVVPGSIFSHEFEDLNAGLYSVTIASAGEFAGDYELMVTDLGVVDEFTINKDNPGMTFQLDTSEGTQTIQLAIAGKGQAKITARFNPANDHVIDIHSMIIDQTSGATIIDILNLDDPDNLSIKNVIVNSSLKSLNCHGTIEDITTTSAKGYNITNLKLRGVQNINLPKFGIKNFTADIVGSLDPDDTNGVSDTKNTISAKYITSIYIDRDVYNTTFFSGDYGNTYSDFEVNGRMVGSDIYGKSIRNMFVNNSSGNSNAIYACDFYVKSNISNFTIAAGDLNKSTCKVSAGTLRSLTLNNGNIVDSTLFASTILGTISVNTAATAGNGNISGTNMFTAYKGLTSLYTAGNISKKSTIYVYSTIKKIITSGDYSGTTYAYNVTSLQVGYDSRGKRIEAGANYTGDLTASIAIKKISISGMMQGDNSGESTINASSGSIGDIFIEDGATGYISARTKINSIMIGTLEGNRKKIANPDANVSLTVSTPKLTRLYYTGTLDPDKTISGTPLIVDLKP